MHEVFNALPSRWAALEWTLTDLGAAVPSWHAADHEVWRALGPDGRPVIAKVPRRHVVGSAAVAARLVASNIGIGPNVVATVPEAGVSVEYELGEDWRIATALRLQRLSGVVARAGAARRAFRQSSAELPFCDPGAKVQTMLDHLAEVGIEVPPLLRPVVAELGRMREAVSNGPPLAPAWMSTEISDMQLGPDDAVLFTGGSSAAVADPLADVGALLTVIAPVVLPEESAFAELWADDHPGAYARARIWGVIADLRSNLHALLANSLDPTSPVGYATYTVWRSWHAEHPVKTGQLESLLRDAGKGWS